MLSRLIALLLVSAITLHAEDRAAVKAWKKDTEEAKKALEHYEFTKAKELYEAALDEAGKLDGDDPRMAETLFALSHVRENLRDYTGAIDAMRDGVALEEHRYGTNDHHLFNEYLGLSDMLIYSQQYDDALSYCAKAQAIAVERKGKYDGTVGICLLQRGKVLNFAGRFAEAETNYLQGLDLLRSVNGVPVIMGARLEFKEGALRANAMNDLGLMYTRQKRYGEADQILNQGIKIIEQRYGKDDIQLCNLLFNLAELDYAQGKFPAAEKSLQRMLTISKKVDQKHPAVIQARKLLDDIEKAKAKAGSQP